MKMNLTKLAIVVLFFAIACCTGFAERLPFRVIANFNGTQNTGRPSSHYEAFPVVMATLPGGISPAGTNIKACIGQQTKDFTFGINTGGVERFTIEIWARRPAEVATMAVYDFDYQSGETFKFSQEATTLPSFQLGSIYYYPPPPYQGAILLKQGQSVTFAPVDNRICINASYNMSASL